MKSGRNNCSSSEATPKPKAGRRGDPRMNKAVEVRLSNPNMSLIDALRQGGFKFPEGYCNNMVCDEENVPLLQRKNQLTRRLRSLKKQKAKCCKEAEAAGQTCTKKCDAELNMGNVGDGKDSYDGYFIASNGQVSPHINDVVDMNRKRLLESSNPTTDAAFQLDNNGPNGLLQYNNPYLPSPNYYLAPQCRGQEATLNQISGRHYLPPTIERRNHEYLYPMNATRRNNIDSQDYSKISLAPNQTISTSEEQNQYELSSPMDKSLNQFRIEFSSLVKKCMITSGFAVEHTEECDDVYLTFLERALEGENNRLLRIKNRLYSRSGRQLVSSSMGVAGGAGVGLEQQKLQNGGGSPSSTDTNKNNSKTSLSMDVPPLGENSTLTEMGERSQNVSVANMNAATPLTTGTMQKNEFNHTHSDTNLHHEMNVDDPSKRQKHFHDTIPDKHQTDAGMNIKDNCIESRTHAHAHEHGQTCQNNKRHYHNLDCGHMPIIHKPKYGPLHVDFVVNGVVECYQGMHNQPSTDSNKLWPSHAQDQNDSKAPLNGNQKSSLTEEKSYSDGGETKVRADGVDFYDFNQLDMEGSEWDIGGIEDLKGIFKAGGDVSEVNNDVKTLHEC